MMPEAAESLCVHSALAEPRYQCFEHKFMEAHGMWHGIALRGSKNQ